MYVLSTDRAELHYFPTPEDVPGGYAILSHVWDDHEQTFQDVQGLKRWWWRNPRDRASAKIRNCCILAESHGYKWLWDDTCCIDKLSSSELSEAINSMFRYYSLAQVCYAYLGDVPSDDHPRRRRSAFQRSKWHERGWTLQELIAPKILTFISKDWRPLGGRTELADVLRTITRIPVPLLRLETKVSDYSIAQRMSWAAGRKTTREEDRAYSLMGIFGIHMSTLYGEGENAFRRLQEEIMRQSVDPSLFLWSRMYSLDGAMKTTTNSTCDHEDGRSYLFANSPDEFYLYSDVTFRPFAATGATLESQVNKSFPLTGTESQDPASLNVATILSKRLSTFTVTPYGVQAHVPVVQGLKGVLLAILCCFRGEKPLGLLLSPCMHSFDPSRPLYHTGVGRVVVIDNLQELCVRDGSAAVEWKEVYITLWSRLQQARNPRSALPFHSMYSPPFRISEASMDNIYAVGYGMHTVSLTSPTWIGIPHITLVFRRGDTDMFMAISLGRCEGYLGDMDIRVPRRLGPRWAMIRFYTSRDHTSGPAFSGHACPHDHIHLWPEGKKRVRDPHSMHFAYRKRSDFDRVAFDWLLSFTPCTMNPDATVVANLNLVFTRKRQEASATMTT